MNNQNAQVKFQLHLHAFNPHQPFQWLNQTSRALKFSTSFDSLLAYHVFHNRSPTVFLANRQKPPKSYIIHFITSVWYLCRWKVTQRRCYGRVSSSVTLFTALQEISRWFCIEVCTAWSSERVRESWPLYLSVVFCSQVRARRVHWLSNVIKLGVLRPWIVDVRWLILVSQIWTLEATQAVPIDNLFQ